MGADDIVLVLVFGVAPPAGNASSFVEQGRQGTVDSFPLCVDTDTAARDREKERERQKEVPESEREDCG